MSDKSASTVYCPRCGAPNSPTDAFCHKCGAGQIISGPRFKWVGKSAVLAVLVIVILIAATLFGTGSIQRIISGGNLLMPSQSTSTVSQTTAETSSLASSLASTSTSTVPPLFHMPPSVFLSAPSLPEAVGCYHYGQTGWENTTCLSRQAILNQDNFPLIGPSQTFVSNRNAFWGIYSNSPGQECVSPGCPLLGLGILTSSILMVNFQKYGGVTDYGMPPGGSGRSYDSGKVYDGGCGDGSYSLQLNTNTFPGNNGHLDWVQFVYQDYPINGMGSNCNGQNSQLCIWNINWDTKDYSQSWCKTTSEHGLSSNYEAIIEGFVVETPPYRHCLSLVQEASCVTLHSELFMYAYINGDYWGGVAPDVYGLAGEWGQSSGGIMGVGAGQQAAWGSGTNLQTDIAASSCPNPTHGQLFMDCAGASAISATYSPQNPTGESSTLIQINPLLTSYYRDTHWWFSSESNWNCSPDMAGRGSCGQFVNYAKAFGLGNAMTFTVDDKPNEGSVSAGSVASTWVNVTSVDGVDAGPITMSVGGMQQGGGLGTEDLTGHPCSFSAENTYVQPGSYCKLPLDVSTNPSALIGSYPLTITGSLPPNVPCGFLVCNGTPAEDSDVYTLKIQAGAPPIAVIYLPTPGSYPVNKPVQLIGYATQQNVPGYLSCSQLTFSAIAADGSGQKVSSVPDTSYQYTGYCDAQMTFSAPETYVELTLSAANAQGVIGYSAVVEISIRPPHFLPGSTPFTFQLIANPTASGIMVGGPPVQIAITISCQSDCSNPQPVQLSAGIPGVCAVPGVCTLQYNWSTTSVTPNSATTVILTITAPMGTPPGPYKVVIMGQGGGYTAQCSVQLIVQVPG